MTPRQQRLHDFLLGTDTGLRDLNDSIADELFGQDIPEALQFVFAQDGHHTLHEVMEAVDTEGHNAGVRAALAARISAMVLGYAFREAELQHALRTEETTTL